MTAYAGNRYKARPDVRVRKSEYRVRMVGANRQKLDALKVSTGCSVCGYNKNPHAMHYHHVDPKTKTSNIAQLMKSRWERIEEELALCVLYCSNCHLELEYPFSLT
jgi:hypothetical protein